MHDAKRPIAKLRKPRVNPDEIHFSTPIDTDALRVEFDVDKLTVTYSVKKGPRAPETLTKAYDSVHALMIISGRLRKEPEGAYAQQCVAKARIHMMQQIPLS